MCILCYLKAHQRNSWCGVPLLTTHSTHYDDVIMGAMASEITSLTIVYSTVYSGADQRKHQSSASLAFVWGIHRAPVNSPHKWPVTRKMFHLMTSSCTLLKVQNALQKSFIYRSYEYIVSQFVHRSYVTGVLFKLKKGAYTTLGSGCQTPTDPTPHCLLWSEVQWHGYHQIGSSFSQAYYWPY